MNTTWRRRLTWLAVSVLIIAALTYGFLPQPRPVDTARVTRGPMAVSIEEEGKTRVVDRYIVSAPVAGTSCRVDLDVGDPIKKDQTLITIKPLKSQALDPRSRAEAQSHVAAAESALHAAEQNVKSTSAEAELAEKELARLQPLYEKGHISQGQLDQATALVRTTQAASRSAEFVVDVARYELEAARTALSYTGVNGQPDPTENVLVRAPITGRLLELRHECEAVVTAGQPLLVIGDTQSLEVETDVLSADAVKIGTGMRVRFHRWGGKVPLEGRVRVVEPVGFTKISALGVEEQRVLVISDITSEPSQWQSLGDGYRVEAEFILWNSDDVLQIPASSLFRTNNVWSVFVVENGKAIRRIVEVGQRNGLSAEITGGLTEGESVITHPDKTIDDRVPVKQR
ncbi:MAG: efflux RND transporter periplasmic adaptor subunit [Gammaproteobacteria bacterium]